VHDLIIIGHGLAGSVLAEKAIARGLSVRVFDVPKEGQASRVAAGVVNPIVLRRLIPSWRASALLPIAETYYLNASSTVLWHHTDLAKLFANEAAAAQWDRAQNDPDASPFLVRKTCADVEASPIPTPFGYGCVEHCAWLDVNGWLEMRGAALRERECLIEHEVQAGDLSSSADHVDVLGERARWVVLCEGPFTNAVRGLVPVAGDVLTVRIRDLRLTSMVHGGVFLLPMGDDLFRVGSTFAWNKPFSGPRISAREHLLETLKAMQPLPVEVVEHRWGVRPAARDRRPILGPLQEGGRIAALNGLGARGVLLAPWCADHLLDHLFNGWALDPEVNARRW
jgi:glycine oxidase